MGCVCVCVRERRAHGCSRDLLPPLQQRRYGGRTSMTSFAYWAPLPHTPRRPPIRSRRAADHARAATRVSRASAALYWRPEPTEVSLSHTLAGFIRGGLFVVVFFFFCSIQAGSSSTWILASSTAALTLFEGAADRRVNPQKPTPAVEKLLL